MLTFLQSPKDVAPQRFLVGHELQKGPPRCTGRALSEDGGTEGPQGADWSSYSRASRSDHARKGDAAEMRLRTPPPPRTCLLPWGPSGLRTSWGQEGGAGSWQEGPGVGAVPSRDARDVGYWARPGPACS